MQINYTGLGGMEVTPAIREFTERKLQPISRRFDQVRKIDVTFSVEKLRNIVDATVHVKGKDVHARSESDDMYKAIDALVLKLDHQIKKHKEKTSDHR